mgnify:CR=1 FL=1
MLKLAQEVDELIEKSYGQQKAVSLEKVLRAFCFTCECACECSAPLIHLSSKAGAEGKVKGKEKMKRMKKKMKKKWNSIEAY